MEPARLRGVSDLHRAQLLRVSEPAWRQGSLVHTEVLLRCLSDQFAYCFWRVLWV